MPRLFATLIILLASTSLPELSFATANETKPKQEDPVTPINSIDLFNGQDLSNWTYDVWEAGVKATGIYRLEEGVIKNAGKPLSVMRTQKAYRDYELEVQWRWPNKGDNSGVLLHSSSPREHRIWPKSIECQLASKDAGDFWVIGESIKVKDADNRTKGRRTINYTHGSKNELGQRNTIIVQARGDTVKVFVNGDLVNEA